MMSKQSKIGFSIAMFDLIKEEKKTKKIYEEVKVISEVLDENDDYIQMLNSSSVPFEKKEKEIMTAFKKADYIIKNTMLILAKNNSFSFIKDILKQLISLLQKELNIQEGIVYSTIKLSGKDIKKLELKVTKILDTKVTLVNYIDKELIGGFKIVIGDIVIEDSIKADLNDLKQSLLYKGEF